MTKLAESAARRARRARTSASAGAGAADYEVSSGNVYADLGFREAEKLHVEAQLDAMIAEIVEQRRLTQTAAAGVLGITLPKPSELLRGHFHGVSERRLIDFLTRLARDVQIVVEPAPRSRPGGRLSVVFV